MRETRPGPRGVTQIHRTGLQKRHGTALGSRIGLLVILGAVWVIKSKEMLSMLSANKRLRTQLFAVQVVHADV